MQRVQGVTIRLSNGVTGLFWGPVLVDPKAPVDPEKPVTVVDVVFEQPKFVAGIEGVTPATSE